MLTKVTPQSVRAEMLDIIQQRMRRRTRDGHSKWNDKEFAELAELYLHWFRK